MDAKQLYTWLMNAASGGACDGFDAHVLASALSLAAFEGAGDERALVDGTGLSAPDLLAVVRDMFPAASAPFARTLAGGTQVTRSDDEAYLFQLLVQNGSGGKATTCFAAVVARRAQRPHHLWQDLGLRSRRELSWLMERHFSRLAARNSGDMKWKKFLYRAICRDEGFGLCVAPSCEECSELDACFGDERGETLLGATAPAPT